MKKKKILLYTSLLTLLVGYRHRYNTNYELLENEEAYAKYDQGYIYIGDEEYLESIDAKSNDILIEDQRDGDDPNFEIYNSYKVYNKDDRNNILEVLIEYEKENPTDWNRSIESMRQEWFLHNLGYYLNYKKDHTTDLDINNEDEEKYNKKILSYIFKN